MTDFNPTQAAVDRLVTELRTARTQFQFYGDSHTAKAPPQLEKAKANYDMVHNINCALMHCAELLFEAQKGEV